MEEYSSNNSLHWDLVSKKFEKDVSLTACYAENVPRNQNGPNQSAAQKVAHIKSATP